MPATAYRITDLRDLDAAFTIREKVFVEGQGVPATLENDLHDRTDARHYLAHANDGTPAGAARWRETDNGVKLERFAVLERGLGRPLRIVVATLKSRHPGGTMTTETHHLDMATMGRDNSLGTIVATMDSSVITGIRIKIETSFGIILITKVDNTIVCLVPTSTSKMIRV